MPKAMLQKNVFTAAVDRMYKLFAEGHRVSVSFSGGKDSGVCLEICQIARRKAVKDGLIPDVPLDVVMRDEEIMLPGTFEYCERVAARKDVSFHWIYAHQPITNAWNRAEPFWWPFDPELPESKWVRKYPPYAYRTPYLDITTINSPYRFPPPTGKRLVSVLGLRVSESPNRRRGLYQTQGYLGEAADRTQAHKPTFWVAKPIYDWTDDDVWKAHHDMGWDYNKAYDVMIRMGVRKSLMRIAPPTLVIIGSAGLKMAAKAWPQWFDKVAERLPGVRLGAEFGLTVMLPKRRPGETWRDVFFRACVNEAPDWIAERAMLVHDKQMENHANHSTAPFPEVAKCRQCNFATASWCQLAYSMYDGDPMGMRAPQWAKVLEPEFFRPQYAGTPLGKWGGKATW